MTHKHMLGGIPSHAKVACKHAPRHSGFSLVELLTVMFIISLLIGLLIPSLNSARNAAKKTAVLATFKAVEIGLDLFKNDNERDFRRTNGYPPSFAHPPLPEAGFKRADGVAGKFPFLKDRPVLTGAHWLPAMLMGLDQRGYIKRSSVPNTEDLPKEPWKWYEPDPLEDGTSLERMGLYLDPGGMRLIRTDALPGRREALLFPQWNIMKHLPVIADPFSQPILYYVANPNGRATNMVVEKRKEKNDYEGGPQEDGPPYYFHQDNIAFTGDAQGASASDYTGGWSFGGGPHAIARSGEKLTANDITEDANRDTFARFILDRKQYESFQLAETDPTEKTPLRPVNPDSYLLISAGVDGRYGTNDDITNFPTTVE